MPVEITPSAQLSAAEVTEVTTLAQRAEQLDQVSPLNDDARLALRHGSDVLHLLARRGNALVGYAQLQHGTGLVVVDPDHRRAGTGRALLDRLRGASATPVGFWSFRGLPAAAALARSAGLVPVRQLLLMTRDLDEPVTVPDPPVGVSVRAFRLGTDEEPWLAVNRRAFVDHPEQGRLTAADLREREAEDWFDPAGFLLATDAQDTLLGFHWTKQHPGHLGEVYVLGVDPTAGGRGLGKLLLAAGLRHLQDTGNQHVQLYVEADHDRAVALYAGYGFTESSRDVMYAQP